MCVCVKHTTNAQTRTIHTWPVLRNIVSCMLKRRRKCRHSRKWQININSLLSSLTYAIRYFYTERKVVYHIKWNIFLLKNGYSQHLQTFGSVFLALFERDISRKRSFFSEFNTGLMIYFFGWLGQHLPSHFWVAAIYFYDTRIYIFWM